jgi:hypothetical protein
LVGVAGALVVGAPLEELLEPAVEVPDDRDALEDLLTAQLQDETQDAVGRGVLRPEVEDQLLGLEAILARADLLARRLLGRDAALLRPPDVRLGGYLILLLRSSREGGGCPR